MQKGKRNDYLSCDYPYFFIKKVEENLDCDALFINGAIGGMSYHQYFWYPDGKPMSNTDTCAALGNHLGNVANSIKNEKELKPVFVVRNNKITIPIQNIKFSMMMSDDVLTADLVPDDTFETGYALNTEVGYAQLDDTKIALIPGEFFNELAVGSAVVDDYFVHSDIPAESSVDEIFGKDCYRLIFSLSNDEIGYILTERDFYLDPEEPFFESPHDPKTGRSHYPETNSLGPKTGRCVTEGLKVIV